MVLSTGRAHSQHLTTSCLAVDFQAKSSLASDLTAAEDSVCRYYISLTSPYTSSHFYGFKATDCATIAAAVAAGTVTGFSNEGFDFAIYKVATPTSCPTSARLHPTATTLPIATPASVLQTFA